MLWILTRALKHSGYAKANYYFAILAALPGHGIGREIFTFRSKRLLHKSAQSCLQNWATARELTKAAEQKEAEAREKAQIAHNALLCISQNQTAAAHEMDQYNCVSLGKLLRHWLTTLDAP